MIIVIGSVTADLLVQSDTQLTASGSDGFRSSNLLFTDQPVNISMGGNGGNSAYVLAGLGAATALCGAVGQDLLGDMLTSQLAARYVDLTGLTRSATQATSTSTIIMTDSASQVVFHHLGATAVADFAAMPDTLFAAADALLVTSFPIMPKLRPGGFARALTQVKAQGGITALDVGPAIGEPVTLQEIVPLLPLVDYLIANTHELENLGATAVWQEAAEKVLAAGVNHLIIKQGERGAAAWTMTERVHAPGFDVQAHFSVGAGDSFNVGFLWAVQQKRPLREALRFGNALAAMVVSNPKGIIDSPTLAQVETFLNERSDHNYRS